MDLQLLIHQTCNGCDNCRQICPEDAIRVRDNQYSVESWSCTLCHFCIDVCPVDCIKLDPDFKSQDLTS